MKKNIFLLGLVSLFFISCSSDDPDPVNEEEVITTMTVWLTIAITDDDYGQDEND